MNLQTVFLRGGRPALLLLGALSGAAALLLASRDIRPGDVPPALVTGVLVVVVVAGCLLPLVAAASRALARSPLPVAALAVTAAFANAVALSHRLSVPPQSVLSVLAAVLGVLLATCALFTAVERRSNRPMTSKF